MNFKEEYETKREQIEEILKEYLPPQEGYQKIIMEAMEYSLMAGGKRLRPMLMAETFRLFGGTGNVIRPFMAAIEMIHTYSLVHDDLPAMDNDDFRRGKPTCHKQFDEATAILAGDGLLTYAFEILAQAENIKDEIKVRLCRLLAERAGAFNGMIAGQMLDLQIDRSPQLSSAEIIKHIEEMKTGCLIAYAAQAGAILGQASTKQYSDITSYARKIGIAFQISDDILDVTGDSSLMGKTLGKDTAQNKLTFVSLYGLDKARLIAADLIDRAKQELASFGDKASPLKQLADFIISRNF